MIYIVGSATVANDWPYIDGGEIHSKSGATAEMNFTHSVDLSTSWTTSNLAAVVTLHQNGNNMLVRDASMFYDGISNMIYWYGGYPYQSSFRPSVWGFQPNHGAVSWQKIYDIGITHATTGSTFPGFTLTTGSLWTSTPTAYYGLGGYIIGYSDPAITGGLWKNTSDTSVSGYREQGFSVHGAAVHVPIFGKNGIIVFIGGDIPTTQAYVAGASLASFSDVTIYDINRRNYYQQTATGSPLPMGRIQFCAAGAAAADNSSFEIFMYRGTGAGTQDTTDTLSTDQLSDFGKVYILSLPAFTWIQVTSEAAAQSIGGVVNNNSTFADPWTNGLGIFDMTELIWSSNFNASAAPYVPSKPVADYHNSTSRYPSSWSNQDLKAIFKDTGATTVTTNGIQTGSQQTQPEGPSTKHTKPGAIICDTIGGLALIAVAGCMIFLLRRKSKKEAMIQAELSASQPALLPEGYYDTSYAAEMGTAIPKHRLAVELGSDYNGVRPLMAPVLLGT